MSFADVCGWLCAIVWGFAYYPSLWLNYKQRSAESVSLDSVCLNLLGYTAYTLSVGLQVLNERVRIQFEIIYQTLPVLSSSDLFYAFHGLTVILIMYSQCVFGDVLWNFHGRRRFKVQRFTQVVGSIFLLYLSFGFFQRDKDYHLLSFAVNLAYFKIAISCIKYVPQVLYNYHRKSMDGSSRLQIALDYFGSLFAVLELLIKNAERGTTIREAVRLNRGKLGLIAVSCIFDAIFTLQFIIYAPETTKEEKGAV